MDKLAVIQSKETVEELNNINKTLNVTIDLFHDLVEIGGRMNAGLLKGTPKEFLAAEKERTQLQKQQTIIVKELAAATLALEKVEQQKLKTQKEAAVTSTAESRALKNPPMLQPQLQTQKGQKLS